MKIYVASSWRNTYQPEVVRRLREMGHQVYDFKGAGDGWYELRWAMAEGSHLCGNCRRDHDEHTRDGHAYPKCPGGFSWKIVDPEWQSWPEDVARYRAALDHPIAIEGFNRDMAALRASDACIMVMPCGPSASMEMGWAVGAKKQVAVWMPAIREPDLMVKMADMVTTDWHCVEVWLNIGM
jgi:hypothetical protein